MKFYDTARPLNQETDASGTDLGSVLLQVSDGMNCKFDEVPDNIIFYQNNSPAKAS